MYSRGIKSNMVCLRAWSEPPVLSLSLLDLPKFKIVIQPLRIQLCWLNRLEVPLTCPSRNPYSQTSLNAPRLNLPSSCFWRRRWSQRCWALLCWWSVRPTKFPGNNEDTSMAFGMKAVPFQRYKPRTSTRCDQAWESPRFRCLWNRSDWTVFIPRTSFR